MTLFSVPLDFKPQIEPTFNVSIELGKRSFMINIHDEAKWVRHKIESNSNKSLYHPFGCDFPLDACKHASMLFCYHLTRKGYTKPMFLVMGISKKRGGEVSHWWVESDDILIDITADQFNLIDDSELSYKVKKNKFYLPVYCMPVIKAPHYKVFQPVPEERWMWKEVDIDESYLDKLSIFYKHLG
ncbi:hypothetical protein ACPV5G_20015 [Photobacterium damselae]|uniref:hypothetical protein n=1 Tax=Photobacterium damselae TaxID=38293 RepID=UPI0040690924